MLSVMQGEGGQYPGLTLLEGLMSKKIPGTQMAFSYGGKDMPESVKAARDEVKPYLQ